MPKIAAPKCHDRHPERDLYCQVALEGDFHLLADGGAAARWSPEEVAEAYRSPAAETPPDNDAH